jgi:hypothetical protein
MRGRSFKGMAAAADACQEQQVLADTAQREGRPRLAAVYRWRAARRALVAMAAARETYGLPRGSLNDAIAAIRVEDYMQ